MTEADRKLYVVEHFMGCDPKLTIHKLVEERDACYIVDVRGFSKVLMKKAAGRHYFQDEEAVVKHLRAAYRRQREMAVRQAARMKILEGCTADVLLAFVRGDEETALWVENQLPRG